MPAASIRADFPILSRQHQDRTLVYLDNAATTQKPQAVIDAIARYYRQHNANVHRAAHVLAEEATQMMENARDACRAFINAERREEIVFTSGTTAGINLVATVLQGEIGQGDGILLTELEHHSNIVPWQILAEHTGACIDAVAVTESGDLDLDDFYRKLEKQPKILAISHVSNALGTVNSLADLIGAARDAGAFTVIDGAQAALHLDVDVTALGCDFYAFSGHKMFGPTGVGVLYGRHELLERLPPWQGGGEMIETVRIERSTFQKPPYRFEAGTPNIAGIVGLGAAIEYLQALPRSALVTEECRLIDLAISRLKQIPGLTLVGEPAQRSAVVSFLLDGSHPHDIGTLLNQQGVAVRTGHHCAMPLMERLSIPGTIRASFSLYNDESDVERLVGGVEKATTFL